MLEPLCAFRPSRLLLATLLYCYPSDMHVVILLCQLPLGQSCCNIFIQRIECLIHPLLCYLASKYYTVCYRPQFYKGYFTALQNSPCCFHPWRSVLISSAGSQCSHQGCFQNWISGLNFRPEISPPKFSALERFLSALKKNLSCWTSAEFQDWILGLDSSAAFRPEYFSALNIMLWRSL